MAALDHINSEKESLPIPNRGTPWQNVGKASPAIWMKIFGTYFRSLSIEKGHFLQNYVYLVTYQMMHFLQMTMIKNPSHHPVCSTSAGVTCTSAWVITKWRFPYPGCCTETFVKFILTIIDPGSLECLFNKNLFFIIIQHYSKWIFSMLVLSQVH